MSFRPTFHELARNRWDTQTLLPVNVSCWRATYSKTSGGGSTAAMSLVSQGPGRLARMSGGEQEFFAEKLASATGWMVSIEDDRVIRIDDQLKADGHTFEVMGTSYGTTDAWLQRVPCREISN